MLRPQLNVCIQRVTERSDGQLNEPIVVTQLWRDFADIGDLEHHVVENGGGDPQQVSDTVTKRWIAGALEAS